MDVFEHISPRIGSNYSNLTFQNAQKQTNIDFIDLINSGIRNSGLISIPGSRDSILELQALVIGCRFEVKANCVCDLRIVQSPILAEIVRQLHYYIETTIHLSNKSIVINLRLQSNKNCCVSNVYERKKNPQFIVMTSIGWTTSEVPNVKMRIL